MPSTRTMARPGLRTAGSAASAFLLALLVVFVPTAAHAAQAGDDFDRADGGLGASWSTIGGTLSLVGGGATGTDNSAALLTGASGTRVSADAYAAPGRLSYVSLFGGYTNSGMAFFAKVQDNAVDGRFDTVWFYYGQNGNNFVLSTPIATPVAQARIALTMSGSTGTFTVDSNFDGTPDQTFTATYPGGAAPAAGIGFYGGSRADNFAVDSTPVALTAPATTTTTVGGGSLAVTAEAAGAPAVGSIDLEIAGQATQSVALDAGVATFDLASLPVGTHAYTARFPQGNGYESARATGSITVQAIATSTTLSASPNPFAVGGSTTLTATVTPSGAAGSVEFFDGATSLGTSPVSAGIASLGFAPTTAGSRSLTAAYSGSATHAASSSSASSVSVTRAVTTTSVVLSSGSVTVGDSATATATVSASGITPAGSVEFFDGTSSLGTATLSGGSAMVVVTAPVVGTHSVTAVYAGNADAVESTSSAATLEVARHAATVTLTAPGTLRSGTPATLRATVTSAVGAPTGSVEFFADGHSLGTAPLVAGIAELAGVDLPSGTVALTAVYNGGGTVASATGSVTVQVASVVPQLVVTGADASLWPYAALLLVLGAVLMGFAARRRAA
jgi:hypothetical protein